MSHLRRRSWQILVLDVGENSISNDAGNDFWHCRSVLEKRKMSVKLKDKVTFYFGFANTVQ